MSVINEMLKDLEKRKAPQDESASNYATSVLQANSPSYKLIIALIILTAIVSISATYFIKDSFADKPNSSNPINIAETKQSQTPEVIETTAGIANTKVGNTQVAKARQDEQQDEQQDEPKVTSINTAAEQPKTKQVVEQPIISEPSKPVSNEVIAKPAGNVEALAVTPITVPREVVKNSDQSLVISKVKLTPQELSLKKLNQAKRYLNDNRLNKAQAWLEEAIILDPYNVQARKQLAALWFGGKSYNQAINLISQGLSLSPNDEEYRLMLARLYSTIGKPDRAFAVLNELPQSKLLEYQIALANIAAQTDHHIEAISAYQKLLAMRPSQGRWWLGMAISLDTNEQYGQAIVAYKEAIATNKLSKNSKQFASQRLAELGE